MAALAAEWPFKNGGLILKGVSGDLNNPASIFSNRSLNEPDWIILISTAQRRRRRSPPAF